VRGIARGLAALNAIYLGIVGLLSVASPSAAGLLYQLSALSATSSALTRILGGMMVGNALMLASFSRWPELNPSLPPLLLAGSVLNVIGDLAACLAGEIRWRQVAGSIVFQLALGVALGAYVLQARSSRE
jgi:hypothetical protein